MAEVSRTRVPALPVVDTRRLTPNGLNGLADRVGRVESALGGRARPEAVEFGHTGKHRSFERADSGAFRALRDVAAGGSDADGKVEEAAARAQSGEAVEPEAVEDLLRELRTLARERPGEAARLLARHPTLANQLSGAMGGGGLDARAWAGQRGPGLY